MALTDVNLFRIDGDLGSVSNIQTSALNGGPLAGFRNVIINGNLAINQRGVDIASVTTGAYGQDRWKKTAGGMTQIIEAGNFEPSATYTLSGTGVTTQQLTAPASGNWTLPDIPVTARKIQLEPGPVATPFEHRPIGTELALCQRYFIRNSRTYVLFAYTSGNKAIELNFPTVMRATPTVTFGSFVNVASPSSVPHPDGLVVSAAATLASGTSSFTTYEANAEL